MNGTETAARIIKELTQRQGFDAAWDDCDEDIQQEILSAIAKICVPVVIQEAGSGEAVACNMPFERIPQHAADPGFGPVPPEPKVVELHQTAAEPASAGMVTPKNLSEAYEAHKAANKEVDLAMTKARKLGEFLNAFAAEATRNAAKGRP